MGKFLKTCMRFQYLLITAFVLFLTYLKTTAQENPQNEGAYYEGGTFSYYMNAPEDWIIDFDNAENDSYTAAFYPDSESYFGYTTKIRVGIFKNGERTYSEFISADSAYLLEKIENLEIIRSDTTFYSSGNQAIIFETKDPGGEYELAMVAYIDMTTETVVYELLISSREYFGEGESRFREALDRFEVAEK